jgi:DNA-binding ferritin-like protein (Dps family)
MAAKWIEVLTGPLEQKKQYRQATARIAALPAPYRDAAKAIGRYVMYYSGTTDGDTLTTMIGDHADLWERAAVDGTPVREIVGDDPVGFAEEFAAAYSGTHWIDKERARLTKAIDAAIEGTTITDTTITDREAEE